jgi:predicted ArsR family transcriptional regulator
MVRTALQIKKEVLDVLSKNGELTLRDLDRKVNTSSETIKTQVKELEYFGRVVVLKHERSVKNGRPYTTVRLKK